MACSSRSLRSLAFFCAQYSGVISIDAPRLDPFHQQRFEPFLGCPLLIFADQLPDVFAGRAVTALGPLSAR